MSDLKTFIVLYNSNTGESDVTEYDDDAKAIKDFIELEQNILGIKNLEGNFITIADRATLEKSFPQFFKNKK